MKVSAALYHDRIEYVNSRNQGITTGSAGPSTMELVLMAVAVVYAAWMSISYWPSITV